ncbi:MAG: hypothetical protein QF464_15830, partial [Myxococcota bacterium]|nr:hypothetical protein [Myxococcota bacterium]
ADADEARRSPFRLELQPSALMYMTVYNPDKEAALLQKAAIDRRTGRPKQVTLGKGGALRIHTVEDREDRVWQEAVEAPVNHFDSESPFGSLGRFVVEQVLPIHLLAPEGPRDSPGLQCLRRMLGEAASELFSRLASSGFVTPPKDPSETFSLPKPRGEVPGVFMMVAFLGNDFPRGSWPWTAAQMLIAASQGQDVVGPELARLFREGAGPVAALAIMHLPMSKRLRKPLAQGGLERLSVEAFLRDMAPVIDGDHGSARAFQGMARVLREASEEERRGLVALAPLGLRPALEVFMKALMLATHSDHKAALRSACAALWDDALEDLVRTVLAASIPPERAAPAPTQSK